jgi:hypothetical protein
MLARPPAESLQLPRLSGCRLERQIGNLEGRPGSIAEGTIGSGKVLSHEAVPAKLTPGERAQLLELLSKSQ